MILEKKPVVKKLDGMKYAAVAVEGVFNPEKISEAWAKIRAFAATNELCIDQCSYIGRCYIAPQDTKEGEVYYEASISVPEDFELNPEEGMELKTVEETQYAMFTHQGAYESLDVSYNYIMNEWVPKNEVKLGFAPVLEIYVNSPEIVAPEDLKTHICIPV